MKPGVVETRASPRRPASMFSSEDLPTLDRPMKANSGSDSSGHESRSGALRSKMADEMFTIANEQRIVAANALQRYNHFPGAIPAGAAVGENDRVTTRLKVAARGKRETVEKVERDLRLLVAVRTHLRLVLTHTALRPK